MRMRLIFSSLGLMAAFLILSISLTSANRVVSYEGLNVSCRKFYVGQTILPDHLLYPVIAAADRAILLVAPMEESIKLKLDYGDIRYQYALGLVEKDSHSLALSTLTKSQKYYNLAARQVIEQDVPNDLRSEVVWELQKNIRLSQQLSFEFSDDRRAVIDELNRQNQSLLETLRKEQ